jgi:hypothetical protein
VSNTSTVTEVGTVTALPYLQFRTNPGPVSATFRISAHMLGTVPGALSTYVPTSGTPANVGATPLGLLIEEQRTNLAFPSVAWASAQAATGAQDGITLHEYDDEVYSWHIFQCSSVVYGVFRQRLYNLHQDCFC